MAPKLSITKTSYNQVKSFEKSAWHDANIEHFGHDVEWFEKKFVFKAMVDRSIVGTILGRITPGVLFIDSLIVDKTRKREGIGKQLVEKAIGFAKQKGAHKATLTTGKDWEANKFYESLGFTNVYILKDHHYNIDAILYEKMI